MESNLVRHAWTELELLGEEPETTAGYLNVIQAFADMGHSGGSASIAIPTINALLQFKNLRPLTNDPAEWQDQSSLSGYPIWQNRRCGEAFSSDGGKTYYLLSEQRRYINKLPFKIRRWIHQNQMSWVYPFHTSEAK